MVTIFLNGKIPWVCGTNLLFCVNLLGFFWKLFSYDEKSLSYGEKCLSYTEFWPWVFWKSVKKPGLIGQYKGTSYMGTM